MSVSNILLHKLIVRFFLFVNIGIYTYILYFIRDALSLFSLGHSCFPSLCCCLPVTEAQAGHKFSLLFFLFVCFFYLYHLVRAWMRFLKKTKEKKNCGRAIFQTEPPPYFATQVKPWGKAVKMKKGHPLPFHRDTTHDSRQFVTFRFLGTLGGSFPTSLRSGSGHICLDPLVTTLIFEQSRNFVFMLPL